MTFLWRLVFVLALALAAQPLPVAAQTDAGTAPEESLGAEPVEAPAAALPAVEGLPDYAEWEKTAQRAEAAIEASRASNAAFEQLRTELVDWRAKFLASQTANASRIQTLRQQIEALGPVPAEGDSEPEEIAARRVELNAQLARLRAPAITAEEAYTRADGLIREIDQIIRERQADELLNLGPSPLNPAHWAIGVTSFVGTFTSIAQETISAWKSPIHRAELRENLPVVLFFLVLALVLVLRGRGWMERVTERLAAGSSTRVRSAITALVSLGQVLLPAFGLLCLGAGLNATGMLGLRGGRLVELVPAAGFVFFGAVWLGGRLFKAEGLRGQMFSLSRERGLEAWFATASLGLVVALSMVLNHLADFDNYPDAARVTLGFPILAVAGLLIYRIGRILMLHIRADRADGEESRPYRNSLLSLIARGAMGVAVAGPVLGMVGYFEAAQFFTYPVIETLALLGLLALVQRFVVDVYAMVTGDIETAGDALIPVLAGFVLALLALPPLSLIWGARIADLTELWTRFVEGFSVGETRISPSDFLTFVLIFGIGYMLTRLVQGGLRSSVLPKTKIDSGGQTAIVSGIGYVGIFLAAILAITGAGIDLSSLAIVAGALSVGIGFGLQNIVSNFVSGIILLIERPVSEGDWIEVGGVMGVVERISVRSTRVQTFDRTDVIVPNSDLISGMVTNWTRSNLTGRIIVPVGVAYGTDTKRVEKILQEIAEAHPLVIINPPPSVIFKGFGADSLDFEVRCILRDVNYGMATRSEINHEIARRFTEEGIEIPFAQRDIWLRNPEALTGGRKKPKKKPTPEQVEKPAELEDRVLPDPRLFSEEGGEDR